MINKVTLLGRLGKDAEVKEFKRNNLIKFSIATSETWKDKDGNKQESTEWHNIGYWAKNTKIAEYLLTGCLVYVEGKIETKKKDEKYYTGIVASQIKIVEFAKGESTPASSQSGQKANQDDNLPF